MLRRTRLVQRGMGNLFQGRGEAVYSTGRPGGAQVWVYCTGFLLVGCYFVGDIILPKHTQPSGQGSASFISKPLGEGNYLVINEGKVPEKEGEAKESSLRDVFVMTAKESADHQQKQDEEAMARFLSRRAQQSR